MAAGIEGWRRRCAGAVLAALLAAPAVALADDAAEARLHFDLATRSFQSREFADALTHFLAAHRLAPTANTIYNIAQTYMALGRPEEAYRFFRDYLAQPGATAENRARTERVLAAIEPTIARVTVTTEPPGATLFIDRVELGDLGTTPRSVALALSPESHTVIVRRAGYREARETVVAERGVERRITLRLEAIEAALRVTTEPAGAAVEVDGRAVDGVTPLSLRLPLGAHQVRIRHAGRIDVVRELTLDSERERVLDERLPRDLARASVLSVLGTANASVTLRGEALGAAPLTRDVDAGRAELRVEAPGRTPWRRELLLQPGRGTTVRVTLGDPSRSRPAWPMVLTFGGAAIAVAGGVLGGLALGAHGDFDQMATREAYDRTGTLNLAADVTLGVGLVAVVAGVIAWVLSPDPRLARSTVTTEALDVRR